MNTKPYAKPSNPAADANLTAALAYLAKHPERRLFPCVRQQTKGGKWKYKPAFRDNLNLASTSPDQLKQWQREHGQRGHIMWAWSPRPDDFALDVDLDVEGAQQALDALTLAVGRDDFGQSILDTESVRTKNKGLHLIFKGKHQFSAGRLGIGLDVPNYVFIAGQTTFDGKRYTLEKDVPAIQAPAELQRRVTPPQPERTRTYTDDAVPLDLFRKMLDATKYTGGPDGLDNRHDYSGWLSFAMAAHEAACGDGADYLDAFTDWSLDDPNAKADWSAQQIERHWESFNTDRAITVTRASWFKLLIATGHDDLFAAAGLAEDVQSFNDDPATIPANDNDTNAEDVPPEPTPVYPEPITAAELLDGVWPRTQYLIDGLILKGYPQTLNADGGTGKTTVATQAGVSIAAGAPFLNRDTMQAPVLLVLCEDDNGVTQERVKAHAERLKLPDPRSLPLTTWCLRGVDVPLAKISDDGAIKYLPFFKALDERMSAIGPGCFVVLDSLVDVVQMQTKDPAPANAFFKRLLTRLCQDHDATILVLAHPSKASIADLSYSHGTLAMKNAVRNALAMRKERGRDYRVLWSLKHNYGGEDETKLYFDDPLFTVTPSSESENPAVRRDAAILEYVLEQVRAGKVSVTRNNRGGGLTPRMIADTLNDGGALSSTITWQQVQSVMTRAERNGVLKYVVGYGKTEAHYEWLGDAEPVEDDAANDFRE